jgi:hypothetical protein
MRFWIQSATDHGDKPMYGQPCRVVVSRLSRTCLHAWRWAELIHGRAFWPSWRVVKINPNSISTSARVERVICLVNPNQINSCTPSDADAADITATLPYTSINMVDPLSLAGLTLAICDELLKLGERTAELVRDIRAFDEVCCNLNLIASSSIFATPVAPDHALTDSRTG